MGLFKTPMPVPPGPKAKPSPTRESDTISRLGETSGLLERLIRLLAPFQPRLITDANGFQYNVLAQDVGRGPVGPRYHVVTLDDVLPEPLSLGADLVDEITPTVLAAIPASAAIASLITDSLVNAATSGTSPSSVVSSVEALFAPALAILADIPDLVSNKLGGYSPIATIIEAKFASPGAPAPRNGDYICTSALGIVYNLVQEQDGFPSNNSIFSVPFTYGTESWYAISPLPVPDIGGVVDKVSNLILQLLKQLIAATVNAALEAVGAALVALFEIVDALIDQLADILGDIAELWAAITALETALNSLWDQINDPDDGILKRLNDLINNAETVEVIGKDGVANTIKVLEQSTGADLKSDFTWIQSSDGHGKRSKAILFVEPTDNVEDVDWREVDWISQTGKMMKAQILTFIDAGHEYPKEEAVEGAMEETTVSTCDGDDMTILKKPSE